MRLRYLHLQNYPPINDIRVCFASGSPLARDCAIRFVVGVNGSGKSNLLRAVAEVFLALADLRRPHFPVTLIYELGLRGTPNHRTLLFDCPHDRSQASLWIHEMHTFPDDTDQHIFGLLVDHLRQRNTPMVPGFSALIRPGEWPARSATPPQIALPTAVLAYTTGDLRPWRSVWNRNQDAQGLLENSDGEVDLNDERPAGWTAAQEVALQAARQVEPGIETNDIAPSTAASATYRRPILLDATLLKCALLAVTLPQSFKTPTDGPEQLIAILRDDKPNALQELLERGGWHHLVSVGFRSRLQARTWDRKLSETAHDWWLCAGDVIAEPHPVETRRTLFFDLKGGFSAQDLPTRTTVDLSTCTTQGEALWALLGAKDDTTFELFTRLLELNQAGLFDDVLLRLRRQPVPEASSDGADQDIGVLRYEELSDGEQMFLGRMALFHLLKGQQDSLLLLDEPETHFNDLWKRDVVSIVDDALAETSVDVLIATHAALMLTDALKDELIVLERSHSANPRLAKATSIRVLDGGTRTFGATGDHPLRDIFGAPDTVGRRASRLLEVLIATANMAAQVDALWARGEGFDSDTTEMILAIATETETGLTALNVAAYLRSIESFALHFGAEQPLRMSAVLETFINQTGPGYFQVELKRAWRRLQERAPDVA